MQLSQDGEEQFVILLMELARAYKLWIEDQNTYLQEIKKNNLILTTINPPHYLHEEMSKKIKK